MHLGGIFSQWLFMLVLSKHSNIKSRVQLSACAMLLFSKDVPNFGTSLLNKSIAHHGKPVLGLALNCTRALKPLAPITQEVALACRKQRAGAQR